MSAKTKFGRLKGFSERTSDIILVTICVVILLIVAYPLYYVLQFFWNTIFKEVSYNNHIANSNTTRKKQCPNII